MEYEEWQRTVPEIIREDSLWKMLAYRKALFLSDLGWSDISRLAEDPRTFRISDQLYRSLGSISSNLAEGYSRSSGKSRAIYYEYALGSARECRDWYYKGRYILDDDIVTNRIKLLTEIIKLLLKMIPDQREYSIREKGFEYETINEDEDHPESPGERKYE